MYVYLQPFRTKGLIDEVNSTLATMGESLTVAQHVSVRAHYAVAAINGLAQSVSYFALWVLSSLSCFATVALIDSFDRWSDLTGGLTVASMIATAMALSSVFYLPAASILSKKIVDSVDASFAEMVDHYDEAFIAEAALQRGQRKSLALAREEPHFPEVYFDPAVKEMLAARRELQGQCRHLYPHEVNAKGAAFADVKQRLEALAVEQARSLQTTPFARKEIDRYLVQKMAVIAEDSIAELYRYTIETWGKRVRTSDQHFDREAFCRNCLEMFREMKVIKTVEHLVRDVKEADDKDQAFKESEQKLRSYVSDIRARINAMTSSGPRLNWWRRFHSDSRDGLMAGS